MASLLAVDWHQHEARYVLASKIGKRVKVQVAASVRLVDVAEGGGEPEPDLGASLAGALSRHKLGRANALIGVERSSIELLHLTLPPARDEELPELVANQAIRESPAITEQWTLDFVAADDDPASPRQVTVAALSPEELDRIRGQCAAAGLKPGRMLLRPLASASLFLRTGSDPEQACLLVNWMGDEADLTVVAEGKPVFSRTVRLPRGEGDGQSRDRLLMEIRRTLAVTPDARLSDEGIQRVYVFGGPDDYGDLVERIGEELSLSASTLDPFAALGVPESRIPNDRGHFASLLGMLLDEAAGAHAIDFLHPRRMPKPLSRWRVGLMAGGVAAVVMLLAAFHLWSELSSIRRDHRALSARLKQLNETLKKTEERQERIRAVAAWKADDVNWLDELRDLSIRFPSGRDAVILRMSMRRSQSGGGAIDFEGLVRDPKVVTTMESRLRDGYRSVRSKGVKERAVEKDYTWLFDTAMSVAARGKEAYVSHLPGYAEPVGEQSGDQPPDEETPSGDGDTLAAADGAVSPAEGSP